LAKKFFAAQARIMRQKSDEEDGNAPVCVCLFHRGSEKEGMNKKDGWREKNGRETF